MDALIAAEFHNAVRRFSGGRQVGPVSFRVPAGTCCGLLGANGAGKTTLLRLLLGLDRPSAGKAYLFGEAVRDGTSPAKC